MKKFIAGLTIISMFGLVTLGQAQDIPVENPKLDLEGNTVTMKADIAGMPPATKQIKIMWRNGTEFTGLHESGIISPYYDWKYSTGNNESSITKMYAEGWRLVQVIPYNANAAKQFYLVFEK